MAKKAKNKKNTKKAVQTERQEEVIQEKEVIVEQATPEKETKKALKKETKKDKKNSKDKRHFWKDFKAELKKVVWPTPKQLVNNTMAVITIVLITTAVVIVLDLGFEAMNKYGINNIKRLVTSDENVTNSQTENTENNNSVDENTEEQ